MKVFSWCACTCCNVWMEYVPCSYTNTAHLQYFITIFTGVYVDESK